MFALAVRHGAIPTNPVRDTGRLRKPRRNVVILTDEHLQAVRDDPGGVELAAVGLDWLAACGGPRRTQLAVCVFLWSPTKIPGR
jgi:hypothetical protein